MTSAPARPRHTALLAGVAVIACAVALVGWELVYLELPYAFLPVQQDRFRMLRATLAHGPIVFRPEVLSQSHRSLFTYNHPGDDQNRNARGEFDHHCPRQNGAGDKSNPGISPRLRRARADS